MESWGIPPSIRFAGFRSRCTHDILFLLQAGPSSLSDKQFWWVCGGSNLGESAGGPRSCSGLSQVGRQLWQRARLQFSS